MSSHSRSSYLNDALHIKDNVDALIARKDAIAIRFSVQINLERTGSNKDGCWVNISGDAKKVVDAKTYIKCLCAPEDTAYTRYPGDLHGYLSEKKNVFDMEQKYHVIIEFMDGEREEDPGQALVKGESLNVALALSAIEDIVASNGSLTESTEGEDTVTHGYSDQTRNKLQSSLVDISDKIDLEDTKVANYSDVIKRLVLSWASEEPTTQEVISLDDSDSDTGSTSSSSDIDAWDQTISSTTAPAALAASTPLTVSSSAIKVEKVSMPSKLTGGYKPSSGPKVYDLTTPISKPGRHVTKVDLSFSDEEETTPRSLTFKSRNSRTSSGDNSSSARTSYSPTSQTEKDISTITLDDDTLVSDCIPTKPNKPLSEELTATFVASGKQRGYDDLEIAQALSLSEGVEPNEETFLTMLGDIRGEAPPSDTTDTAYPKSKPVGLKPRTRNAAMESLNKRQKQQLSPSVKAALPTGKRVKTGVSDDDILQIHSVRPTGPTYSRPATVQPMPTMMAGPSQMQALRSHRDQQMQAHMASRPRGAELQGQGRQQGQGHQFAFQQPSNYQPQQFSGGYPAMQSNAAQHGYEPHQSTSQPPLPPMPAVPSLPAPKSAKTRMVVLDGSNIAISHGKKYPGREKVFSAEGILLAIDYLRKTYDATHENVKAIVPNFRRRDRLTRDAHLLDQMEQSQFLVFSPCKTMPDGRKIVPYDDRFILDLAHATDGVVISNDKYADLMTEQQRKYHDVISNRIIMFMFVGDMFMIPEDPMGRYGPTLDTLLRPTSSQRSSRPPHQHRGPGPQAMNSYTSRAQPVYHQQISGPSRQRSAAETHSLTDQLLSLFPERENEIRRLLQRHPHEKDASQFINLILDG